jgi:F0F1-type ATP synthase membrane subunit b/b'
LGAAFLSGRLSNITVTNAMTLRFRLRSALTTAFFITVAFAAPLLAAEEEPGAADSWMPALAKLVNFAVLAGGIYYFFGGWIRDYLRTRSETIRKDLVDAKTLRSEAEQQLAGVRSRLAALPAELSEMKKRGEEELAAEKVRLAEATAGERTRVQEQTRREIEMTSRLARRELMMHSANLSMTLAKQRIERDITPEDQARLVEDFKIEPYKPEVRQ